MTCVYPPRIHTRQQQRKAGYSMNVKRMYTHYATRQRRHRQILSGRMGPRISAPHWNSRHQRNSLKAGCLHLNKRKVATTGKHAGKEVTAVSRPKQKKPTLSKTTRLTILKIPKYKSWKSSRITTILTPHHCHWRGIHNRLNRKAKSTERISPSYTTTSTKPLKWEEHATTNEILFSFYFVLLHIKLKHKFAWTLCYTLHILFYQGIHRSTGVG